MNRKSDTIIRFNRDLKKKRKKYKQTCTIKMFYVSNPVFIGSRFECFRMTFEKNFISFFKLGETIFRTK